jgi:hypothetical protein
VLPTAEITLAVPPTLAETTVKPISLARLVLTTPIVEFSMEARRLDNPNAKLMELADLAPSMLIAPLPFLTAVLMEVAILALLQEIPVEIRMVVKTQTNKTAILLPTSV